jgi:hypothetical protein
VSIILNCQGTDRAWEEARSAFVSLFRPQPERGEEKPPQGSQEKKGFHFLNSQALEKMEGWKKQAGRQKKQRQHSKNPSFHFNSSLCIESPCTEKGRSNIRAASENTGAEAEKRRSEV